MNVQYRAAVILALDLHGISTPAADSQKDCFGEEGEEPRQNHESQNEIRILTNAYFIYIIDYDSVTMPKNTLRIYYKLTMIVWNREFVAKILNISKLLS